MKKQPLRSFFVLPFFIYIRTNFKGDLEEQAKANQKEIVRS